MSIFKIQTKLTSTYNIDYSKVGEITQSKEGERKEKSGSANKDTNRVSIDGFVQSATYRSIKVRKIVPSLVRTHLIFNLPYQGF